MQKASYSSHISLQISIPSEDYFWFLARQLSAEMDSQTMFYFYLTKMNFRTKKPVSEVWIHLSEVISNDRHFVIKKTIFGA